ncbi:hypothetical protein TNCV_5019591 [Trichonephila clavipes]|nr:hypothetical protein TNCV_5019591 [Trichonephila clavipes]
MLHDSGNNFRVQEQPSNRSTVTLHDQLFLHKTDAFPIGEKGQARDKLHTADYFMTDITFYRGQTSVYLCRFVTIQCGRGSLVIKVTDSWLMCHEFWPSTPEDFPRRGDRCTLNMSGLPSSRWCCVEVRREICQLRCRPRHLTWFKITKSVANSPRAAL